MNYTVIWKPIALRQLADAWNNAADRNAVSLASHRIDQLLERDPLTVGESRPARVRFLAELPLAITIA